MGDVAISLINITHLRDTLSKAQVINEAETPITLTWSLFLLRFLVVIVAVKQHSPPHHLYDEDRWCGGHHILTYGDTYYRVAYPKI
jgi:hypothetical protein